MKQILFIKRRIHSSKLKSKKGASVMFALIGFMFAAMISMVVVNAAYSAASRVKKLKYDEQAFLLAQSMSGIIADALSGSGEIVFLADGSKIIEPSGEDLKYDGLTLSYQYIEQRNALDGSLDRFLVDTINNVDKKASFKKISSISEDKKSFTDVEGRGSLSNAASSVQNMVLTMCKRIDKGVVNAEGKLEATETLTIHTFENPSSHEKYDVKTVFKMDSSFSINAVTTATVTLQGKTEPTSTYIVRMDAKAVVRTDKIVCVGKKDASGDTINTVFNDKSADGAGEELVKISNYSVTWPPEQLKNVYKEP